MAGKRGRWSGRPSLSAIEKQAIRQVAEFKRRLEAAGLTTPPLPPVPAEYLALTLTGLTVRGISNLKAGSKALAGMLDTVREEICYEENDPPGRQNFTIAHELGHYFLHYLPALENSRQPTLFRDSHFEELGSGGLDYFREEEKLKTRFYRCAETEVDPVEENLAEKISKPALTDPASRAKIAGLIRQKEISDRLEWEANIFARGLLMPSDWVRQIYLKFNQNVKATAAELGVTQTALRYRLNGLKLRHDENMGLPLKGKSKAGLPGDQASFL